MLAAMFAVSATLRLAIVATATLSCQLVAGLDAPLVSGDASVDAPVIDAPMASPYARAVLDDQPLVYYRLDEASGITAHDSSGHGTDATLLGTVALGASGAILGDPNTALELASTSAKVVVPNAFDFAGPATYTFELWILPQSTAVGGSIFEKTELRKPSIEGTTAFFGPPSSNAGIQIGFERWHQPSLVAYVHEQSVGLVAGVYNHFECDAISPPRMYLNGIRYDGFAQNNLVGPDKINASLDVAGNFLGKIDEVAVYDHALAETRVLVHFRIGKTAQ